MVRWGLGLILVLSLGLGSARADSRMVEDPGGDAAPPGVANPLDLSGAGHGHSKAHFSPLLVHDLRFQEAWTAADVEAFGIFIYISTDRDAASERVVSLGLSEDESLWAEVLKLEPDTLVVGFGRVWRPDELSIRIEFPRTYLGPGVDGYRWWVRTRYEQPPDCGSEGVGTSCSDRVPDRGLVRHGL